MTRAYDRKYAIILLAAAAAVLATGILLRPAPAPQKTAVVDLERLQQMTQERRLQDLSDYLTNAADRVASSLVYLNRTGSSGLVWGSRDEILAPAPATVPFLLVPAKEPAAVIPAYRAPAPPAPGEWVLAVAKNRERQVVFAHGLYQGRAVASCASFAYDEVQSSAPLSNSLIGGGLFTLRGQLLGFIAACDNRPTVIAASSVEEALRKPVTLNDRLQAQYGMRVASSAEGVRVAAVWKLSPADSAGLRPGDLLKTVDGAQVAGDAVLEGLAKAPDDRHEIEILRGRRRLTADLRPADLQNVPAETASGMALAVGSVPGAVTVLSVSPDSAAQRSGILPGDVLRRVGSAAVAEPGVALKLLNKLNGRPVVLALVRDGKELEVLLQP
jgi:S1-C subfamily serine protease